MAKNKIQSTRKQRQQQNKRFEAAKCALAHSTPHFTPRESWASKRKAGGVPLNILEEKQREIRESWRRDWFW